MEKDICKIENLVTTTISDSMQIDKENIQKNSKLSEELGITSFDIFNIMSQIEDELKMELGIDQVEEINTVQDLIDFVFSSVSE